MKITPQKNKEAQSLASNKCISSKISNSISRYYYRLRIAMLKFFSQFEFLGVVFMISCVSLFVITLLVKFMVT